MAGKTPILDESSVKARPIGTPLVDTRVSPDAFGASVGQALQAGATAVDQKAKAARMEAAQFAADAEDLKFARTGGSVYAAQTHLQLEAATNVAPALDKIEEIRQQHEDNLKDDLAKRLFLSASRRRAEGWVQSIEMHAADQRNKFYFNTAQGKRDEGLLGASNSISTLAAGPATPGLTPEQAAQERASLETEALDTTRTALGKSITAAVAGETPYYKDVLVLSPGELDKQTHKTIREGIIKAIDSAIGLASTTGAESAAAAKVGLGLLDGTIPVGGANVPVAQYLGNLAPIKRSALMKAHSEEGGRAIGIEAFQQTYDPEVRQVRDGSARAIIDEATKGDPIKFSEATKSYELEAAKQQRTNDTLEKGRRGGVAGLWNQTHDYNAVRGSQIFKSVDQEWATHFDILMLNQLAAGAKLSESAPRTGAQWAALQDLHKKQTDSATSDQFLGQPGFDKLWGEYLSVLHPKDFAAEERKLTDSLRMKVDPPWLKTQVDMAKSDLLKAVGPQKKLDVDENRAFNMTVLDIQNQLRREAAKSSGIQTQEIVKLYQDLVDKYTTKYVINKRFLWFDETAIGAIAPPGIVPQATRRSALGAAHTPTGLPKVRTVEEARALPKGTRFVDPNGVERVR